jgi:hypothetical protein
VWDWTLMMAYKNSRQKKTSHFEVSPRVTRLL